MKKPVTGSHSGTGWWLAQRFSAVVMLAVGTILFAMFWYAVPFDYASWKSAFEGMAIKLLVWLLVASLCLHAWIGLRDVLMDYVRPIVVRLVLNVLVMLMLAMSTIWASAILWGAHG
jgi:succinate dehydrogenase / fumarate reductase membrane anchor subunit